LLRAGVHAHGNQGGGCNGGQAAHALSVHADLLIDWFADESQHACD
jgi:hypothetical protein